MAYKRNLQWSINPRTVRVSGSFVVSTASAGLVSSQLGDGLTFSNATGVGVWTITLADYYPTLISATGSVRCVGSTAKNQIIQFGDFSAANKTLVLRAFADGSASDLTTLDVISVQLELGCSTVPIN